MTLHPDVSTAFDRLRIHLVVAAFDAVLVAAVRRGEIDSPSMRLLLPKLYHHACEALRIIDQLLDERTAEALEQEGF